MLFYVVEMVCCAPPSSKSNFFREGDITMTQNAIELIKSDHRKVEGLYQQYQEVSQQETQKQVLMESICQELTMHAKIEESIFYPAVQQRLGASGANLVQEAIKEHN